MNAAQRKEYWRKVERLRAQLDAKYFEQVRNSIIAQFKRFARDIEAIGVDAARSRLGLDLWDKEMLKIFEAMYKESVVLFGNSVYRALKIEANQKAETFGFNREWTDAVLEFLLKQGFVLVADITSTTKKKLLDIVSKGIEEGLGVDEIVRIITSDEQLAYATFRARRIVRTEVMRSSNIGAMKGAEAHPFVVDKEWISARDSRTRRIPQDEFDHVELDGVIVGFDEYFTSTGKQGEQVAVQQPGQLDNKNEGVYAPAGFTINCRCTVAFIPKRDANGRLVMKPKVNAPVIGRTVQSQIIPEKPIIETTRYTPKKTIKEAEEWARQNLNVKFVSFKGIDIGIANDINESVYNLKQIMPDVKTYGIGSAQAANKAMKDKLIEGLRESTLYKQYLKTYGLEQAEAYAKRQANSIVPKVSSGTIAWSTNREGYQVSGGSRVDLTEFVGVFVNEKEAKSKTLMDSMIKRNRDTGWFTQSAENFGYTMQHEFGHEVDKTIKFRSMPEFEAIFNREHSMGIQSVASKLSRYGATGNGKSIESRKAEMIAESWAEFMTSNNPRPLAKEIGELMLRKYYEKNNITIPFNTWINQITKLIRK